MIPPLILRLTIERFRGIRFLTWLPTSGTNIVLGGGDVGKTTILDAIALLLAPSNATTLSDADYHGRNLADGFAIEAVISVPTEVLAAQSTKPSWPWEWKANTLKVPSIGEEEPVGAPVYVIRASGTANLELLHEIIQPNGQADHVSVGLRQAIGIVRLGGDDRNDRDLRLVQGSALERLLSDRGLRSRLGNKLAQADVKAGLQEEGKQALVALDAAFKAVALPADLDLAVTGAQGISIAALIGLTADRDGVQLPLSSWGSGTRRLCALTIAAQNQNEFPITIVDEIERGLEPYRQRALVEGLQSAKSQVFITTHSTSAVSAATGAALWYLDYSGKLGRLDGEKIAAHQVRDPEAFLSRLTIVVEGATEVGFVTSILTRALRGSLQTYGITVSDGTGHETTLNLLEALSEAGLKFGGFADNEGDRYPERWSRLQDELGPLLFRWENGCLEENFIPVVPADRIEEMIAHPEDGPGSRLRTLALRLGIDDKSIAAIGLAAGDKLLALIIETACGIVPRGKDEEKRTYKGHAAIWFKSIEGGQEIAAKMLAMGLWPIFKPRLMPFINAVRTVVGLQEIEDLPL